MNTQATVGYQTPSWYQVLSSTLMIPLITRDNSYYYTYMHIPQISYAECS